MFAQLLFWFRFSCFKRGETRLYSYFAKLPQITTERPRILTQIFKFKCLEIQGETILVELRQAASSRESLQTVRASFISSDTPLDHDIMMRIHTPYPSTQTPATPDLNTRNTEELERMRAPT